MTRLLRLLTLGAIAAAAWVLLKEMLDSEQPGSSAPESSSTASAPPAAGGSDPGEPSKAELYERAKQLQIEGRSKMSKQRLAEAVAAAENGASE